MEKSTDLSHFYVKGTNMNGEDAFVLDWIAESPEEALNKSLEIIPRDWSGGIEVLDEETCDELSMPLIDYWKEPDSSQAG
jgi:hypothetical protein